MKTYFDVHVNYGKSGYSLGVVTTQDLDEDKIIELLIKKGNCFEEKGDSELVDSIEEIDEKSPRGWFGGLIDLDLIN